MLMTRTEAPTREWESEMWRPLFINGKKKNKGPVKPVFHRAFVVLSCEVLSGGLSE